jgi:hypothetical protein
MWLLVDLRGQQALTDKKVPNEQKRPVYLRADPQGCIYFLRV